MTRVLHLTDRLSERGGADWHLLGVLAALARTHEVILVAGRDDGTAAAPCEVRLLPGLDDAGARPMGARLDALLRDVGPDAIHVHNVMNPEALAWAADRGAIMTVQDHRAFCPGRGKLTLAGEVCARAMEPTACAGCFEDEGYFRRIYDLTSARLAALSRMRAVTVLSRYMRDELVAAGVEAQRVHVIPPFVHGLDRDAAPSGPPCVLVSGRLVRAKGVWDAAAAWRRAGLDLPLVFAGTGSERPALEEAGFEVLGWVPHRELSPVLRRAGALLFAPRWQEPFGIAGLEALWMGVPVAAWRSGGVAEWHPAPVPYGDVDALAAELRRVVGTTAKPPPGFEAERVMASLAALYG